MKVELVVDPTAPTSFADRVGYVYRPWNSLPGWVSNFLIAVPPNKYHRLVPLSVTSQSQLQKALQHVGQRVDAVVVEVAVVTSGERS